MKREDLLKLRLINRQNQVINSLIITIIGDYDNQQKAKSGNKSTILDIMSKIYNGNLSMLDLLKTEKDSTRFKNLIEENEFLSKYVQITVISKLSEEDLSNIISEYISTNAESTFDTVMKFIVDNYRGKFDGKIVAPLIKKYLNN